MWLATLHTLQSLSNYSEHYKYANIKINKEYYRTLHQLPDYATDVDSPLVFLYHDFSVAK